MRKIKIALAQINYRPALILDSHEVLVEPIFSSMKEPHTSISMLNFEGCEKVSSNLREKYLSWLRSKVVSIIEKCNDLSVDLLVFPEYSIPFQLLNDICSLTQNKKIHIVAGTHMVTRTKNQLPKGYPEIKNCLRCAMAPIISNGQIENYTFKKIAAAEEHNCIKIPKESVPDSFNISNYTLNVKICIEAIADQDTLQECEGSILAIPSLSRNIEPFQALQILAKYKEMPVIYVNGACYGGSLISGPYSLEGKHWFVERNISKPIPKNCEALVTATVDIDAVRHSVGTVLLSQPIELNEVIPLLYKESEADNKLMQLIDQCIDEETIAPLSNMDIVDFVLKELIKKLQVDEKQGILDGELIRDSLDYVKIKTCDFQQMTVKQVEDAASMLASRAKQGFSDDYYVTTQEKLYTYLNRQKKYSESIDLDFSNDKGLFRGRDSEKNALSRFFDDQAQKLICINGLRGIGKSKLVNAIENEVLPADSVWNIRQIRFSIGVGYDYIIDKMSYDLDLPYIETSGKKPTEIAVQYARQIKKYSPIIVIIDDFHYCLNNNGYFTDQRVREFFINFVKSIYEEENVKIVLTSNRRIREPLQEIENTIEVSKLNDETIQSIISYCYKKITKGTSVPKIEDKIVKSAYGNPLAAILIAQLIVQKDGANIDLFEKEFKRYQEGLIKRIIEEIEFTADENELLKIVAVAKGEIHTEFIKKYFSQLFYCIGTLSNRLIIESSQGKLSLHPLFREVFYSGMEIKERFDVHKKYSQYFEEMNDIKGVKQDPEILSSLIYHLGGSFQVNKLGRYKQRFIDELKPIADQFYKDKNYKNALKYYEMIYNTLGKVRYDILLRIAICYLLDGDNVNIDKSKDFFKQASLENPKAAFIWAEYSIALSNMRKYYTIAIEYAKRAEEICDENEHPYPWERAKIMFAYAKAYRYQNFDKAMEYCKEACELDDTNVYYLCAYADMLLKSKNYETAKEYVEKAEILQPHDKFLIRIKGKITDVSGNTQHETDNLEDMVALNDSENENLK